MRKFTGSEWTESEGVITVSDANGNWIWNVADILCCDSEEEANDNVRLIASATEMYAFIASIAHLPDEQCMISPLIHDARKFIQLIDNEEAGQ